MNDHLDIAAEVRSVQDQALAAREQTRPPVAARLVALHAARLMAKRRHRRVVVGGSAAGMLAVAAALLLFVIKARPPAPLSFTIDAHAGGAGGAATAIEAPVDPVAVQFSDGSALELASRSSMRVLAVESSGAEIVLEHGSVRTHVVPRAGNRWSIAAGPYRVQVTGTRFDTTWEPSSASLRVAMQEGHVLVTGGCLAAARPLAAGETMEISCAAAPKETSTPVTALPSASLAIPTLPPATAKKAVTAPALASADEMMNAADAARRAGQRDAAEQTYRAVRTRYPGSGQAARATFLLGRMLADGGRSPEAEALFIEYAHASPNGTFAEEAAGRLLEIAKARGDADLARSRARHYMDRFPNGASAEVARAVLER